MRRLSALLVLLALGACAGSSGGVTVSSIDIETLYTRGLLQWAAAGRDMPVVVIGNPTEAADADWQRAVTDALNASSWAPDTRFTTEPDGSERGNFHFTVAFGAPSAVTPDEACRGAVAPALDDTPGAAGSILLAFCNEGRAVTSARATTAPILSPGAPQLAFALDLMMRRSLPLQNPYRMDSRDALFLP